ncbi:hypothetical protein TPHA_0K01050 [Tetrapisispora phaffii CBS 4417]|uniref:ATP synthase subunit H, mitochondrial n=1 Tax=Tetrapisispora phaffii (strain ATCC 24235 / CBS 4417 / NBRC 1672 / NRRL Y-8282 / UCD 70-5) TaxID=1071381 RepID=G8BZB1_TETPH|nr:hypothetical protein TPHA_0K01050 [Tetrapisispora phaffii CBS 4417]CCE65239.1 hypothetical protein TPHA_0K01050 [Tetrapisispora phaffii CBS 4417]
MFAASSRLLRARAMLGAKRFASTDVLQDVYLKELKSVKSVSFADAVANAKGNVKQWVEPARPAAPAFDLSASDVKKYIDEPVETAAAPASATADAVEEDWLVLDEPAEDEHAH